MHLDEFEQKIAKSDRRRRRLAGVALIAAIGVPVAALAWHHVGRKLEDARWQAEAEAERTRPLAADEATRLRHLAQALHDSFAARASRWKSSITPDALARVQLDSTPCPTRYAPSAEDSKIYVESGTLSSSFSSGTDYEVFAPNEAIPDPDAISSHRELSAISAKLNYTLTDLSSGPKEESTFAGTLAAIDAVASRIAAASSDRADLEKLEALESRSGDRIIVVASIYSGAEVRGGSFKSAHLVGTAYLVSDEIVCAGVVDVENSSTINVEYWSSRGNDNSAEQSVATSVLARDFDMQMRRSFATGLHRVHGMAGNNSPP